MRKMMSVGMLVLSLGVAGGCGDSVQNNMQRAQIAVNRAKFDHALELADKVLAAEPGNLEAARIKARSLLQLGKLEQAYDTISQLLKDHPQDLELRQFMSRWGLMQASQVIGNSALFRVEEGRIIPNAELLAKLDQARQIVNDQAQWMANEGQRPAEAEYLRAEIGDLNIRLLDRRLHLLTTTMARTEEDIRTRGDETRQVQNERERTLEDIKARLASTLRQDPEHRAAAMRYNAALQASQDWHTLWDFLKKSSEQKELNETLVSQMVLSLLQIPNTVQPVASRIELGWKLSEVVPQARRQTIDWWTTNARLHMMAGQYAKAIPLLEQVRSKAPNNNDARYLLASCYYHQNQFQQAHAILKVLAVELNRSPNVALLHGMTLRQLGDSGAREALRHAIDLDPTNPLAREQMILLSSDSGNSEAAQADLEAMYRRDPSNPRAIRFMLQYLRAEGNTAKVTELLTRVEQINPRLDEYLATLIDGYSYLGQSRQAEQTAREWVARNPEALEPNLVLARLLLSQNKAEDAHQLLGRLKGKFAQDADLDDVIGTLYLQQRQFDKAIEHLDNALDKSPGNAQTRLKLAQAQLSLVLNDEALENVEKVLEQDPTNTEALGLAARIHQAQGRADKAAEMLSRIDVNKVDVRRNPLMAAQIKARAEQYDDAIAIANQAIFAGNDDPALRMLLAAVYIRKGNANEAENQLISLVRSQPDNWLGYTALASFYTQSNQLNKGISTFQGMTRSGNQLLSRLALAGLYARDNKPSQALNEVQGLLKPMIDARDPRTMTVAAVIASLHVNLKQPERAHAVYQSLIDAKLNVPQAQLAQIDLGIAGNEDPKTTVDKLDALLKTIPPEQRALTFQVVRRYARLREFDKALGVVDGWLAQTPDNVALASAKGGLLLQAGRNVEAAKVYAAAVEKAPDNAELWLRLAQSHARGYQFPEAEKAYQSLAKLGTGARAAALTELGQLYSALGLNKEAAATFETLDREGNLRDPRVRFALGVAAQAIGKHDVAVKHLDQIPKASNLYGNAQIRITQIDQARGKTDDARKRLSDLARDRSTAAMAAQQLINLSMRDKNNEELLRWSNQMLSLESLPAEQRIAWLNIRANLALNSKDWVGAANALNSLSTLTQPTAPIIANRILLAVRDRQFDTARKLYQDGTALKDSPLAAPLAALLDLPLPANATLTPVVDYYVALRVGDASRAAAAVEQMPAQPLQFKNDMKAAFARPDFNTPEFKAMASNLLMAELALAVGMNSLATDITQAVLRTHHGLALAQSVNVKALASNNEANREAWTRIVREVPGSDVALQASSQLKVLDRDFAGAAKDAAALLSREPGNDNAEYRLAGLFIQAKQHQEAITLLEGIVAANGRFTAVASNDLAYLLAVHQPQRLAEARTLAAKAQQAMPRNPALLDTVGWINHLGGDHAAALPLLVRANAGLKDSAEVHYHLGVVYAATGNAQWARYHLDAAQSLPEGKDIEGLSAAIQTLR